MAIHRAPQENAGGGRRIVSVGLPIVLVGAVVAGVAVYLREPAQADQRDGDLCPIGEGAIAERAVLLLDLRKPWNDGASEFLAEAVGDVASGLAADAELRVFALSGTAAAPRQSVDRFCKPYDGTLLELAGGADGACENLPPELAERESAMRFCTRRNRLQRRVGRLAAQHDGLVANAYLVEAIEETSLELAAASGPKSLFILSDMMQHAPWYSHAERDAASLSFSEFEQLRSDQNTLVGPAPAAVADVDVTIFYVPRSGVTEESPQRREHKRFWQEYVANAFATAPSFHDLPAMPPFEAVPFSDLGTEPEAPNVEWESLQREREEAERLLEVVERERAALEEARVVALERAEQLEREAARRQRELAAAEAEAERRRREAAAAELAAANPLAQQPAGTSPEALSSPAPVDFAAAARESASASDDEPVASLPSAPVSEPAADLAANLDQDAAESAPPSTPPAAAQPPPTPLSAPELPPIAATVVDGPSSTTPCPMNPKPRFQGATPPYPERARRRFGAATITVSYLVDEQGNTVDNAVSVVESQSTARPEQFFDLFASQASEFVQRLEFDFEADAGCVRRQEATTTFQFNYR